MLGTAERTVIPEHQNYQVRLSQFLKERGVNVEMEKNFVDVSFSVDGEEFIGEIKVTRNLTLAQAFRTALGQLLEYGHLLFAEPPQLIMFLDQKPDERRLQLATDFSLNFTGQDIPDPFYGDQVAFDRVMEMGMDVAKGILLQELREK